MITYLLLGLWISSTISSPIQSQKSAPLVYYSPATSQYVQSNFQPFVQYPSESPAFGKALQSIATQNELLFYPTPTVHPQQIQQPYIVNAPQQASAPASRFTAPPSGLVDAIYAWFAENNLPLPDDPSKNEASLDIKDQEKPENTEKTAGEAEILAEADRNPNLHFPKKPISPKFHPGQRFYILNGQPQFFSNYQPQPVIPQLLTRSAAENILFLQPQAGIKKQDINPQPEQSNQNIVLLQDQDIKPVRYHSTELKAQNYIFVGENRHQEAPQVVPYSRQQLLIGRLLPQSSDIKQVPIHQTQYVPVGVVPPQEFHQQQQQQQEQQQQHPQLAFIHIPVDRNVQPPQYITAKSPNSDKPYLFLSSESQPIQHQPIQQQPIQQQPIQQLIQQQLIQQQPIHQQIQQAAENEQQNAPAEISSDDLAPGIAALEFARYISSRQGDLYSDSVVIDAKTDSEDVETEAEADAHQEPSIAQAQPGGIALAGPGGVAATAPRGTALAGEKGLAIASPHATAVAGPHPSKEDKEKGL